MLDSSASRNRPSSTGANRTENDAAGARQPFSDLMSRRRDAARSAAKSVPRQNQRSPQQGEASQQTAESADSEAAQGRSEPERNQGEADETHHRSPGRRESAGTDTKTNVANSENVEGEEGKERGEQQEREGEDQPAQCGNRVAPEAPDNGAAPIRGGIQVPPRRAQSSDLSEGASKGARADVRGPLVREDGSVDFEGKNAGGSTAESDSTSKRAVDSPSRDGGTGRETTEAEVSPRRSDSDDSKAAVAPDKSLSDEAIKKPTVAKGVPAENRAAETLTASEARNRNSSPASPHASDATRRSEVPETDKPARAASEARGNGTTGGRVSPDDPAPVVP